MGYLLDPTWLDTGLAVIVCTECSGIHRRLGPEKSKVKSITFGSWDARMVEIVKTLDNKKANEKYEKNIPPYLQKPNEKDS